MRLDISYWITPYNCLISSLLWDESSVSYALNLKIFLPPPTPVIEVQIPVLKTLKAFKNYFADTYLKAIDIYFMIQIWISQRFFVVILTDAEVYWITSTIYLFISTSRHYWKIYAIHFNTNELITFYTAMCCF